MSQFQNVQRQLASFIRDPQTNAPPAGIEERRLNIYKDLFYKNIEGFIAGGFPVLKSIILDDPNGEDHWQSLVRDFMVKHQCQSPYFLEISQEFLLYLQETRTPTEFDPPYMLELAHYEWVELALDVAEDDFQDVPADPNGDLLENKPVVSPVAWSLAYHYPVHKIGTAYKPTEPPDQPSYLVVYRNRHEKIRFMEANAVTARLIELLNSDDIASGREALLQIAEEIQHPDPEQLLQHGLGLLDELLALNIILGTR